MNNYTNEKFFEGQIVNFKIIRIIVLPDNKEYYLLESPLANRYMMRKSYYENYKLAEGSIINCHIDKVNCSGKIFMEPEHPLYVAGKKYNFRIVDTFTENNIYEKEICGYIVEDVFNNKIKVICNIDNKYQPKSLSCFIVRIKKGVPILNINNILMFNNKTLKCLISDKINNSNGISYYILKDNSNNEHYIQANDYESFNLQKGNYIECIIVDINNFGEPILEPLNPYYEIGKNYKFKVKGWTEESDHFGESRKVLVVKDLTNKNANVYFNDFNNNDLEKYSENDIIECTVIRLKKGRLQLTPLLNQ